MRYMPLLFILAACSGSPQATALQGDKERAVIDHKDGRQTIIIQRSNGEWHVEDRNRDGTLSDMGTKGESWTIHEVIRDYADNGDRVTIDNKVSSTSYDRSGQRNQNPTVPTNPAPTPRPQPRTNPSPGDNRPDRTKGGSGGGGSFGGSGGYGPAGAAHPDPDI